LKGHTLMERTQLSQARHKKFWTLEEAAEHIGVDVNTLHKWEHNKASPRAYNLQRICEVYQMTAEELGLVVAASSPTVIQSDITYAAITDFLEHDLTLHLMDVVSSWNSTEYDQLQNNLMGLLEEYSMDTTSGMITRRDTLRRLAAMPFATFGLARNLTSSPLQPSEEMLKQYASAITACWELSKSDDTLDIQMAFEGVSAYLPVLRAIVKDFSQYRKQAASLAGQGALLQTLLGWHLQGLKEAARYAQDAVKYSKEAGDTPLLLATLDYLAWVYYYDKKASKALETIQQSIPLLKQKQPLPSRLLGGIYSTLALMQSKNGQSGMLPLRQAAESFFSGKQEESRFVYMDYTVSDLVLNDAMVHYQQAAYDKALDSLSQLVDPEHLTLKMVLPERSRVEALNVMTLASLKHPQKDMERSLHFWYAGIQGAKALRSEQRFDEAVAAFDIMDALWSGERRIKELQPLTIHW